MRAVIFLLLVAAASCFPQKKGDPSDKNLDKFREHAKDLICKGDIAEKIAANIKARVGNGTRMPSPQEIKQHIKEKYQEHLGAHLNASRLPENVKENIREHIAERFNSSDDRPVLELIKHLRSGGLKEIEKIRGIVRERLCDDNDSDEKDRGDEEDEEDEDEDDMRSPRLMLARYASKTMALTDALTDLVRCAADSCRFHNKKQFKRDESEH
ncbi:uncharacterized protein LOC135485382 [Lineus longissimus]|uniref:uncharacterized protein LOC135485382 n=1 Tax=Lineus longissimus TaxID=88925 RepID=UPI002B4D081A